MKIMGVLEIHGRCLLSAFHYEAIFWTVSTFLLANHMRFPLISLLIWSVSNTFLIAKSLASYIRDIDQFDLQPSYQYLCHAEKLSVNCSLACVGPGVEGLIIFTMSCPPEAYIGIHLSSLSVLVSLSLFLAHPLALSSFNVIHIYKERAREKHCV